MIYALWYAAGLFSGITLILFLGYGVDWIIRILESDNWNIK
jgi:hypothetical protein